MKQEERQLLEETEDGLINLLKTISTPSEQLGFIKKLRERGASKRLMDKILKEEKWKY